MGGVMRPIVVLDGVRQENGCQRLEGLKWFGHQSLLSTTRRPGSIFSRTVDATWLRAIAT
jgi:hypothetical protein